MSPSRLANLPERAGHGCVGRVTSGLRAGPATRLCLLTAAAVSGCAGDGTGRRPLTVFAAASLADAFGEMETAFESAHPETDVGLVFAGSQVLRLQIEQGARADVFASADRRHIESLEGAGLLSGSRPFAGNELAVILPPDNPARIESFADLARAERLVIGTQHVPVGAYAREALRRGGGPLGGEFEREVLSRVVSEESSSRLVRAKVELGIADAAIVYRTDVAPERVRAIPVPPEAAVRASYLMGIVADAPNPEGAAHWLGFVASPTGREILARRGFAAAGASTR